MGASQLFSSASIRRGWTVAIVLLLAWLPVLLYVDHWSAPALFAPQHNAFDAKRSLFHSHPTDGAASHVDHGHGGGADSSAAPIIPAPSYDSVDAGHLTAVIEPLPQFAARLNIDAPPLPPPR